MKARKIISIVLVLVGVFLFLFAIYAKNRVMEVKKSIHSSSGLLPDNAINQEIGKALEKKISSYDVPILWGMIGGIVFIVVGVGTFVYGKKR